jgi:alkylation response protein AidB-like acyl-CoA dehydrogenase
LFTTDHWEFVAAIEQFCGKHCATAQREALTDGGRLSNSPQLLQQFADLSCLGVSLPAGYGGAWMAEECIFPEDTIAYVRYRGQFGRPIGANGIQNEVIGNSFGL